MKEEDVGVKWFNTVFYPQRRAGRAVRFENGVLPRLRAPEVTFFTPWGPRYSWETRGVVIQEGDREVEVLNFLARLLGELRQNMPGKSFRWVLLGADLYGTRINGLPCEVVTNYFESLTQWLGQILPIAEFQLWSQFDKKAEEYRREIRVDFDDLISPELLSRTNRTARAMGRGGDPKEYLVERLVEAALVEEAFHPIKISCVARHKDDEVDGALPRLYFLPEHLHAPWL
jgi:hypothetical protein